MLRFSSVFVSCLLAGSLSAKPVPNSQVEACLRAAAAKHAIAYPLLQAIAWQESSFNPSAIRKPHTAGGDASTDYGLMQINSSWLPTLAKHGVRLEHLFDPCVNADVGAWILASNFAQLGVTWNAVGAYNARTHWKRVKYANGVYDKLKRIEHQMIAAPSNQQNFRVAQQQTKEAVHAWVQQTTPQGGSTASMAVFEANAGKLE